MNEVEVLKNEIASMQKQLNNAFKRINELVAEKEYKVEIIFTQPLTKEDPADWILEAVNEGKFKENTNHVHATSVSPIDLESDEYKWLSDATK